MSTRKSSGPSAADNRRAQLRAQAEASARKARQRKIAITAVSVVVVAALLVVALVWTQNRERPAADGAVPPNSNAAGNGQVVVAGVPEDRPLVEVFFDYQCPGCAALELLAGEELAAGAQAGEYQLVYRTMTFMDKKLRNDASTRAANAASCYAEVGDYAAYHQAVFANQPKGEGTGYTDDLLRDQLPAQLGTSGDQLAQFQTCYDEGRYASFAEQTDTQAARDGVTGTPTIRVDGEDFDRSGVQSAQELRAGIVAAAG